MAKEYFDKLSLLINKIYPKDIDPRITIKHFFSGAAIYSNKKICITLTPVGLAVKLPEDQITKLLKEKKAKPLQYYTNCAIKK